MKNGRKGGFVGFVLCWGFFPARLWLSSGGMQAASNLTLTRTVALRCQQEAFSG